MALTYVKGRPGCTTTALGLAALAPARSNAVLVECDPAGGDLIRRHQLAATPNLMDLTTAAQATTGAQDMFMQAGASVIQDVVLNDVVVPAVPAPPGGAHARAVLPALTAAGPAVLAQAGRLVVADCGRLDFGSPVWPLLRLADAVLVVVRARPDELAHLREAMGPLMEAAGGRLRILLAHGSLYPAAEVADILSTHTVAQVGGDWEAVRVLGPLPNDRRGAAVLGGWLMAGRRWRHLPLPRAHAQLWSDLTTTLPELAPADACLTGKGPTP
ncbi:hypothetical protein GCM10010124_40060 [Pilimelia terevasa]|uniref:MinD-like ATPase involved in chromosome partitioning or flagellar assembly n=1 Tax=Pilimelia terevasa TaxID=53372 RepID=A0A8J3FK74_9ACTN|nr:hypothetical protein GCM10010124_40060 [Pilimelia terevasa]